MWIKEMYKVPNRRGIVINKEKIVIIQMIFVTSGRECVTD
jgi:hypothetical protein